MQPPVLFDSLFDHLGEPLVVPGSERVDATANAFGIVLGIGHASAKELELHWLVGAASARDQHWGR